jgi:hypothetical protein
VGTSAQPSQETPAPQIRYQLSCIDCRPAPVHRRNKGLIAAFSDRLRQKPLIHINALPCHDGQKGHNNKGTGIP